MPLRLNGMGNEGNKTMEQKDAIHFPLSYLRERYASGGNEGGTDATGSRLLDQERSDMEGITRVNRARRSLMLHSRRGLGHLRFPHLACGAEWYREWRVPKAADRHKPLEPSPLRWERDTRTERYASLSNLIQGRSGAKWRDWDSFPSSYVVMWRERSERNPRETRIW